MEVRFQAAFAQAPVHTAVAVQCISFADHFLVTQCKAGQLQQQRNGWYRKQGLISVPQLQQHHHTGAF